MDDADFLRQLAAQPNDDALRAVYADWLDDQADRRGEYVRVELELLGLARSDARYATLENRLKTLRMDFTEEWLAIAGKRYDVILVYAPPEATISTIKTVRAVTGLGLEEAYKRVIQTPSPIKTGVSRSEAEQAVLLMETFYAGDADAVRPTVELRVSMPG